MFSRSAWTRAMTSRAALTTLGLAPSADITHAHVKKAYIAQTLRCHPDLCPDDPDATEKFRRLSEALRVALKSLEMRRPAGATTTAASYDSQSVLDALRHAIAAYHTYRDAANEGKRSNDNVRQDPFFSPSLEYVSSVCQTEAAAMRRVKQFCNELPEVLCGRSCVLFEAVAFFNARYVEAMSHCVLRFSKNLPIIVSRVVKGRKKYVRYTHTKANAGVGTGSRPREQRIEDMAMKPLVLVGALLFDQDPKFKAATDCSYSQKGSEAQPNTHGSSSNKNNNRSTCGAVSREDIQICEELICTIYPSDSIGNITEKIGVWEAASYERLQLELAMVDTTSILSSMLDLNEHCLAVMHHLHLPKDVSEKVSLTLQKLVCGLCYHCDEKPQGNEGDTSYDNPDKQYGWRIADGINRCRYLARATAPHIEGNITLMWDNNTPLVENTEEVAVGDDGDDGPMWRRTNETDDKNNNHINKDYVVVRHMSCCTAEMIRYAVSVKLSKDLGEFLSRLVAALEVVLEQADASASLLSKLLEVREKVVKEEFIPLQELQTKDGGAVSVDDKAGAGNEAEEPNTDGVTTNMEPCSCGVPLRHNYRGEVEHDGNAVKEEEDEHIEYRYRGPIRCFPRIFSMNTSEEYAFWRHVHEHRVYLAPHVPAMNAVNVYYNCFPYKPHPHAAHHDERPSDGEVLAGWVGEGEDGTDDVVITHVEMENGAAFREWLEEIVEQSSLNKECNRIVSEAGVGYVTREPTLPLPQYLSFVKVFCGAAGVRGILERKAGKTRMATPEETGLTIVVGTECDVRDGGRLLVPWWMDPSVLVALLHDNTDGQVSLIEDGTKAAPHGG
ncbi:putative DNAJ-domain protein [Trypanosoma grayi]|uniref:putative DNAJ-domain protein n=1 Tax=Trypanosoma grayi TaxID=71804 RepID=UPI0004F45BFC|nr:putative DNAJ-domain protein [Trypanosoma grayi]KEG10150.1 putative DNAJ-domain protein [Trypanosoma grayi]